MSFKKMVTKKKQKPTGKFAYKWTRIGLIYKYVFGILHENQISVDQFAYNFLRK